MCFEGKSFQHIFILLNFSIILFARQVLCRVTQLAKLCTLIVVTVVIAHLMIVEDRNSIIKVEIYFYYFLLSQYTFV